MGGGYWLLGWIIFLLVRKGAQAAKGTAVVCRIGWSFVFCKSSSFCTEYDFSRLYFTQRKKTAIRHIVFARKNNIIALGESPDVEILEDKLKKLKCRKLGLV